MSVVTTVGMFDGVHLGHRYLLDFMASTGSQPHVVTFTNHPLGIIRPDIAPPLITTPEEKEALLRGLGCDVTLLPFDDSLRALTAREFIHKLRSLTGVSASTPLTFVMGFDNHIGSDRLTADECRQIADDGNISLLVAPQLEQPYASSSAIRRLIAEDGDIEAANASLGHPFRLTGTVVHGDALGRQLGFPTANIRPDSHEKIIPAPGVYAARCIIGTDDFSSVANSKKTFSAVVNIGVRPTVTDSGERRIEAHLVDFQGNLYGRRVTLTFIRRLRDEQHFPDIASLRAAIAADIASLTV